MMAIVTWLLSSKLGRILLGSTVIVGAFFAFKLWLSAHDSSVASQARSGYVLLAEKTTVEAKAAEIQRQLEAAKLSLASFQKRLETEGAQDKIDDQKREESIRSYELLLSEANRRCTASAADVEFITK